VAGAEVRTTPFRWVPAIGLRRRGGYDRKGNDEGGSLFVAPGGRLAVCWGCGGSRQVAGWFRPAGGDRIDHLVGWRQEKCL